MENKIYVRPRFRKLKDNEYMSLWYSLRDARAINRHGPFVFLRDVEVYQQSQNFLLGDGIAGFAIRDGVELISVHKNNKKAEKAGVQHILPKIVRCAFKYGAKYGDCYGEFLANYYMKSGFIVVGKVPFDSLDDNPHLWDFEKHGKPNCYLLMRGVKTIDELDRLKSENATAGFDAVENVIPTFATYEEGEEYRDELYNKIKNCGYKKRLAFVQSLRK